MIKKLSFQSEGFIVDWLSFKIESLNPLYQERLVDYLFQIGFNSYIRSRKSKDSSKEILRAHPTNSFEAVFLKDNPYWGGTIVEFSGENAKQFYQWLKDNNVNWNLFRNPRLSRVDLYYSLETPLTEEEARLFFHACQINLKLNLGYQKNRRGQILRIGRRSSDRFSRIYTRNDRLRFEHEMKGQFIEEYSNIFVSKSWEDFEDVLSQHFLHYFGKHLAMDSVHLNWLAVKLRSIRPEPVANLIFKMDYISSIASIEDQKKVVQFLKFLVYAKDLDYVTQSLGSTRYRCVSFRVQDFLKFQEPTVQVGSQYKVQKLKKFFKELQTDFLLSMFRDYTFQKLISVPKVEFWKDYHWMVKVWIVDELFYYNYPFAFPDMFHGNISKTKFAVQFEIIRVFSSLGFEKRFDIHKFIHNYPSRLSNQTIRQMKELFVESVKVLQQNNLIQSRFKIIREGNLESVDVLTYQNISEGFVLYEQLNFLDLEF
jgi:hypothetical protein